MAFPSMDEYLEGKLTWLERVPEALSGTDERLNYVGMALKGIHDLLEAPPPPVSVSVDGRIDSMVSTLTYLTDNLAQLIIAMGGEPVGPPVSYRYEKILKDATTISSKQTKDIHEAVYTEKGGLIWLMGSLNSKQATLIIQLDNTDWEFDLEQLVDGRVDTPYAPGLWITEESVGATTQYAFVFSGGEGLRYQTRLRVRLRNDGSAYLTLTYVKGLKKVFED